MDGDRMSMHMFEKIKVVGQGAFGKVTLVRQIKDDTLLVIKQIPIQEMPREERQAALNEVDVLKMLKHPNIVAYEGSFLHDQSLMIVMEYAPGGTLFDYLQHKNGQLLEEEHILQIFAQIVVALYHVHSLNILHRDLKTQNIMLSKRRNVIKVGDFGISKVLSSKMTSAHTIVGTPCYISPEICEGRRYNKKSDIWALGCLLYELITLHKAFEAMNLPALVMKITQGSVKPIDKRFSKGLQSLVTHTLSLKPDDRPSIEQIMADPTTANAVVNLYTDIGRLPYTRPKQPPIAGSGGRKKSLLLGKGARQRSFFEDCWADDEETLVRGPKPRVFVWGSGIAFPMLLPPVANSNIMQVAVGRTKRAGVTDDGKVVMWEAASGVFGTNTFSTLGLTRKAKVTEPPTFIARTVDSLAEVTVKKVVCGDLFTACLTDRGIVMTFGSGSSGCLGHGNYEDNANPRIIESIIGYETVDVACGAHHVLALMSEGQVFAWGKGEGGSLGLSSTESFCSPKLLTLPEGFSVVSIFCGPDSSALLSSSGQLLVCGSNRCGKLAVKKGVPQEASPSLLRQRDEHGSPEKSPVDVTTEMSPTPERELTPLLGAVATKPKAVAQLLSSRKMSTFIVSSLSTSKPEGPGSSPKEGKDGEGAISGDIIVTLTDVTREFPLEEDDKIVTVALGQTHSVFTTARGRCLTCGANTFGQLGHSMEDVREPQCVKAVVHENVDKVSCGDAFTVATTKDGQVYTWGKSQRGRLGREAEEPTHEPKMILFEGMQTVMSVAASHGITLLLTRVTAGTS